MLTNIVHEDRPAHSDATVRPNDEEPRLPQAGLFRRIRSAFRRRPGMAALALVALAFLAAPGHAAAFIVSNTADGGPGSLRQAILDANAGGGANTITFDPVVFGAAQTITLGSSLPALHGDIAVTGPAAGVVINGADAYQILSVTDGVVELKGLTFAHGAGDTPDTTGVTGSDGRAGGLQMDGGTVTVTNCTFLNNRGGSGGPGGEDVLGNGGSGGGGGAGALHASAGAVIANCTFSSNAGGSAGASGNQGPAGGAGALQAGDSTTIANCTFSGNTGGGGGRGGDGGVGSDGGIGGVGALRAGNGAAITNCTFYGNTGGIGGNGGDGFSGGVGGLGGDGALRASNATILTNCTVAFNVAGIGGAGGFGAIGGPISGANGVGGVSGGVSVGNCLFAANNSGIPGGGGIGGGVTSRGYNLSSDDDGATLTATGDQIVTDLRLDPNGPQDNGGPTPTVALLPGPAVNAGSNSLAVDADGAALANDQRGDGFPRIVGGTVDVGSYEFNSHSDGLVLFDNNGVGIQSSPSADNGVVYFGDEAGVLHGVDTATGQARSGFPVTLSAGSPIRSRPALYWAGGVEAAYVMAGDGHLWKIPLDGSSGWSVAAPGPNGASSGASTQNISTPVVDPSTGVVIAAFNDDANGPYLAAFDNADGHLLYQSESLGPPAAVVSAVASEGNHVYVGVSGGTNGIYMLQETDLSVQASFGSGYDTLAPPLVVGPVAYFGSKSGEWGYYWRVNSVTGALITTYSNQRSGAIQVFGGLTTSPFPFLSAIPTDSFQTTYFASSAGDVFHIRSDGYWTKLATFAGPVAGLAGAPDFTTTYSPVFGAGNAFYQMNSSGEATKSVAVAGTIETTPTLDRTTGVGYPHGRWIFADDTGRLYAVPVYQNGE